MRKIQKLIFTVLISAMLAATALAGDYAHFHFIGFSRDARYLAFEEYGINDDLEDSSPYSVIYIVNVRENKWAIGPFKANGDLMPYDENGQYDADKIEIEVRDRNKRNAARQLRRFKIIEGNTGLQTIAHLINEYPTDYDEPSAPPPDENKSTTEDDQEMSSNSNSNINSNSSSSNSNTIVSSPNSNSNANTYPLKEVEHDPMDDYFGLLPQQVSFTKRGNALYRDGLYTLKIKPVPVTQKNCDEYERDMFSFELTLKNEANETRLLQSSGAVPKNRGCVNGYGIQEAFLYRNQLAVFVGVFTRGWEGENLRLMVVTGELDQ